MTQNVKKWSTKQPKELVAKIASHEADILCLSEHKDMYYNKIKPYFTDQGYQCEQISVSQGNPRLGGLWILARQPFRVIPMSVWCVEDAWRLIMIEYESIIVSAVYWPQAKAKKEYWENWLKLCSEIHMPHLSIGDFNTGRNDLDKTDKGAKFHCAEYFDRLNEGGMIDVWRELNADEREYTWFSNAGNGFRIDHAFGNEQIRKQVKRCYYDHTIRESGLSDHATMIVEF